MQRLEQHEAWSNLSHAQTQARLYPATQASWLEIAGGVAVYCGANSPISKVYGVGLSQPVTPEEFHTIRAFYDQRCLPARFKVTRFTDPAFLEQLTGQGAYQASLMNVFVRRLAAPVDPPGLLPGLIIQEANPAEARRWFELDEAGGDWAEPDGIAFMLVRCIYKPDTRLYLAWLDGQPVAAAGLELHKGVAGLVAASTLPEYRQRGLHQALLYTRLCATHQAGCELAMVHADPAALSQGNILRAGFKKAYEIIELVL